MATDIRVTQAASSDAALLTALGARTFRDTFAADNTEADMTAGRDPQLDKAVELLTTVQTSK